jgi:hypothetical protein
MKVEEVEERQEARDKRQEARGKRQEARGKKQEARGKETRLCMQHRTRPTSRVLPVSNTCTQKEQ